MQRRHLARLRAWPVVPAVALPRWRVAGRVVPLHTTRRPRPALVRRRRLHPAAAAAHASVQSGARPQHAVAAVAAVTKRRARRWSVAVVRPALGAPTALAGETSAGRRVAERVDAQVAAARRRPPALDMQRRRATRGAVLVVEPVGATARRLLVLMRLSVLLRLQLLRLRVQLLHITAPAAAHARRTHVLPRQQVRRRHVRRARRWPVVVGVQAALGVAPPSAVAPGVAHGFGRVNPAGIGVNRHPLIPRRLARLCGLVDGALPVIGIGPPPAGGPAAGR
mmetsp:Transcript_37967/g.97162  ORF Transcript_37967/g.97162 Transcript_37967/m.97162 type:complete len:280 (-) Transcript_37967:1391-2230(-)